jgi:hypothetical protein
MQPVATPVPLIALNGTFNNIVGVALGFAGIGLFIMLLIGGFKFITSGGDPKAAGAAKQTLTFAIIGMVLIACSFLIIRIIGTFTGINLSVFNIYKR